MRKKTRSKRDRHPRGLSQVVIGPVGCVRSWERSLEENWRGMRLMTSLSDSYRCPACGGSGPLGATHPSPRGTRQLFTAYLSPTEGTDRVLQGFFLILYPIGGERNRNQEFRFRFRQCRYRKFWQEKAREFVIL